jgi:outer membrane cobalamin receptor
MSTVGAAQQYDAERDEATNSQEVETVIVTARRTDEAGFDLATSWAILDQANIERVAAQHSNQLFNRVSGAWVSRGNGQESLVSLRSPVLTGAGSCGAFMTAEDGISMRSPGFCNVNQLFDANLLQAGRVEVLKGPGAVVFGSNALHGIINVVTAVCRHHTQSDSCRSGLKRLLPRVSQRGCQQRHRPVSANEPIWRVSRRLGL